MGNVAELLKISEHTNIDAIKLIGRETNRNMRGQGRHIMQNRIAE